MSSVSGGAGTGLEERYGVRRRRWPAYVLVGALAAVSLGWLLWAAVFHATPTVRSELLGHDVRGEHELVVRLMVTIDEDPREVGARCVVRALAEDHAIVGDLSFVPEPGLNEVVIRTERKATAAEPIGCTADGQSRPR